MRVFSAIFIGLFSAAICFAQTTALESNHTTSPTERQDKIVDLVMGDNDSLTGWVVDRQGNPQQGIEVSLANRTRLLNRAQTDKAGRFEFRHVAAGPKFVRAGRHTLGIRAWDARLAPPSANPGLLIVNGEAVRAQCATTGCTTTGCTDCTTCNSGNCGPFPGQPLPGQFGGVFQAMLRNPWLIAAGTATAIAIPLATDEDDERDGDNTNPLVSASNGDGAGSGEPAS